MKAFPGRAIRAARESYIELPDEGEALDCSTDLPRKTEAAIHVRDRFEDVAEENQGKIESWHAFKTH
jgi:hypothetical protein